MISGAAPRTTELWSRRVVVAMFVAAGLVFGVNSFLAPLFRMWTDSAWAVASGAAAGHVFWRLGSRGPQRVLLPASLWLTVLSFGIARDGRPGTWAVECEILVAVTSTAAVIAALRPSLPTVGAVIALVLCSVALRAQNPEMPGIPRDRQLDTVLGAAVLLTAGLAVRGRPALAAAALGTVVLFHFRARMTTVGNVSGYVGVRITGWLPELAVIVAILAGGACARRWLARSERRDAPAPAVWVQRHPWLTSLGGALPLAAVASPWIWRWGWADWWIVADTTRAGLLVAGLAFLVQAAHGQRGVDRLAPLLAAGLVASCSAAGRMPFASNGTSAPRNAGTWLGESDVLWVTMGVVAFAPLVTGGIAERLKLDAESRTGSALRAATVAALVVWLTRGRREELGDFDTAAWLATLSFAIHAAVTSRLSNGGVVLACGVLGAIEYAGTRPWFGWSRRRLLEPDGLATVSIAAHYVSWLLGGLLIVAARRIRSMTVIPDDHPVAELNAARART